MADRDPHSEASAIKDLSLAKSHLVGYLVSAVITLVVLIYAMNPSLPWESDQPAKAAQIGLIAEGNDYTLSKVPTIYRLKLFPLYYSVSALIYKAVGGDLLTFMNVSSVPLGVIFVVGLSIAFQRAFQIRPIWTTLVLLSMPLVVITFSYGNEVAWALAFFAVSMALATCKNPVAYLSSGIVYAMAIFCRVDFVFLGPFWLVWVSAIATEDRANWKKRAVQISGAAAVTIGILWLLLIREVPPRDSFEWSSSLALLVANLVYPFNPTIILLAVPSWLWFRKKHSLPAWSLLLLLLPVLFYIGSLSSPKYVAPLIVGYALLASWLLEQLDVRLKAITVTGFLVWWFFAVSIYGAFGPVKGSQWYLPTADGPCPSGAYLEFYRMARSGVFQVKQLEHIDITADVIEYVEESKDPSKILGHFAKGMAPYLEVKDGVELPESTTVRPQEGDHEFLMTRTGYINIERMEESWKSRLMKWLEEGRVRGVGDSAGAALPSVIKIGDAIPEGENKELGKRILFMIDRYRGHMVFTLPEYIPDYLPTCWSPSSSTKRDGTIYQDAAYFATDEPTGDCVIYSYVWPARYYNQPLPAKF
jgi:hypothetical protein